jgi:hypothetical protein
MHDAHQDHLPATYPAREGTARRKDHAERREDGTFVWFAGWTPAGRWRSSTNFTFAVIDG